MNALPAPVRTPQAAYRGFGPSCSVCETLQLSFADRFGWDRVWREPLSDRGSSVCESGIRSQS